MKRIPVYYRMLCDDRLREWIEYAYPINNGAKMVMLKNNRWTTSEKSYKKLIRETNEDFKNSQISLKYYEGDFMLLKALINTKSE